MCVCDTYSTAYMSRAVRKLMAKDQRPWTPTGIFAREQSPTALFLSPAIHSFFSVPSPISMPFGHHLEATPVNPAKLPQRRGVWDRAHETRLLATILFFFVRAKML